MELDILFEANRIRNELNRLENIDTRLSLSDGFY